MKLARVVVALLFVACGGGEGESSPALDSCASAEPLFHIDTVTSSEMPTVATVTWSLDEPVTSAHVDFGPTPDELSERAPVDLRSAPFHTQLVGLKSASSYFVRITTEGRCGTRTSLTTGFTTGSLPIRLPPGSIANLDPERLFAGGGFTVTCTGLAAGSQAHEVDDGWPTWAFILDRKGEVVWAYELTGSPVAGCSRARLSLDGQFVWIGNLNDRGGTGALRRVSLDGVHVRDYATPARHHDFAILPNDHLVYAEQKGSDGADVLRELDPATGGVTELYDQTKDFARDILASHGARTSQVNYVPELGALSFSMLGTKQIGVVGYPGGDLRTVFGGLGTTFKNLDWEGQYGHDVRAGHAWVLVDGGKAAGSDVVGFLYDVPTRLTRSILDYSSGMDSLAFGDLKELPNGNLFVTYSMQGVFQELTADGVLLREQHVDTVLGYSEHRASLYGAPPPYDRD